MARLISSHLQRKCAERYTAGHGLALHMVTVANMARLISSPEKMCRALHTAFFFWAIERANAHIFPGWPTKISRSGPYWPTFLVQMFKVNEKNENVNVPNQTFQIKKMANKLSTCYRCLRAENFQNLSVLGLKSLVRKML